MNDFKDYPKSITEAKATSIDEWTPRDALINTLRDIDEDKIAPDTVVIAYCSDHDFGYRIAGNDVRIGIALLQRLIHKLIQEGEK